MRIEKLAAGAGVTVRWRPFNLREILIEQNNTGFVKNPVKMNYFWRDIERRAKKLSVEFHSPAPYPADPDLLAACRSCRRAARLVRARWRRSRSGSSSSVRRGATTMSPMFSRGSARTRRRFLYWRDQTRRLRISKPRRKPHAISGFSVRPRLQLAIKFSGAMTVSTTRSYSQPLD